jgi:hypothetical protein
MTVKELQEVLRNAPYDYEIVMQELPLESAAYHAEAKIVREHSAVVIKRAWNDVWEEVPKTTEKK